MKINHYLFLAGTLLSIGQNLYADSLRDLANDSDREAVKNGKQVAYERDDKRSDWPEVVTYQRYEGSPKEIAALFFDYNTHKDFMPDLTRSETKTISPTVARVTYRIEKKDGPFTHVENYIVENNLHFDQKTGQYTFTWKMISSDNMKNLYGYASFQSLGEGSLANKTLAVYRVLVDPKFLLKHTPTAEDKTMKGLRIAGQSIVDHAEKIRREYPSLLEAEMQKLDAALAASNAQSRHR